MELTLIILAKFVVVTRIEIIFSGLQMTAHQVFNWLLYWVRLMGPVIEFVGLRFGHLFHLVFE